VSSHYANLSIWVSNLDSEDEAEDVTAVIESALGGAGYKATVSVDDVAEYGEKQ
jgi:hypothetical protein